MAKKNAPRNPSRSLEDREKRLQASLERIKIQKEIRALQLKKKTLK